MAAFLGKIAMLLDIAMIGGALIVLHFGKKEASALLKGAGYLFLISGIALTLCTGYYAMKYHFQGDFDHAYAQKHHKKRPWDRGDKLRRHHKEKPGEKREGPRQP